MDELERLIAEKKELEQKIKLLISGAIVRDMVKLDKITSGGKYTTGKWALFYKYAYVANAWRNECPTNRTRWIPIINGDCMEDVINHIPDVINALNEFYEFMEGEKHGTDS